MKTRKVWHEKSIFRLKNLRFFLARDKRVKIINQGVETFHLINKWQKYHRKHISYYKFSNLGWRKVSKRYLAIKKIESTSKWFTYSYSVRWKLSFELSYIPIGWLWTYFISKFVNTRVRKIQFMKKAQIFFTTQYMCTLHILNRGAESFHLIYERQKDAGKHKLFKNLYCRVTWSVKTQFCHNKKFLRALQNDLQIFIQ